jgi:hypothetical protein
MHFFFLVDVAGGFFDGQHILTLAFLAKGALHDREDFQHPGQLALVTLKNLTFDQHLTKSFTYLRDAQINQSLYQ